MKSPPESAPPATFTDYARRLLARIIDPASSVLLRAGVSPNAITVAGLLINLGVGIIVAAGNLTVAGVVFLASGLFDGLDGALARRIGITSRFGAFLDSMFDRYSEAFVLFGLLVYTGDRNLLLEQRLVYFTLVGSLLVSYARARAEGLGIECKVGLLTRLERFFITSAMLIFGQVTIGLALLAILTNVTVLQRMLHVWRALRRVEESASNG